MKCTSLKEENIRLKELAEYYREQRDQQIHLTKLMAEELGRLVGEGGPDKAE